MNAIFHNIYFNLIKLVVFTIKFLIVGKRVFALFLIILINIIILFTPPIICMFVAM